jgi:hypothetical protein|tara:strand:- start:259 stop:378 length:120 start_codon:yes stop_codon:yes gene_type:complete
VIGAILKALFYRKNASKKEHDPKSMIEHYNDRLRKYKEQ